MDVTLHQLRCFLAVARERHFSRAAGHLRISPSTLSEQISGLERLLDRRLFERSSRAVTLTGHGEELLPLARNAVDAGEAVVAWAGSAEPAAMSIGVMASSPAIRAVLSSATVEMPGVEWSVRPVGFTGGLPALRSGAVDCAFLFVMPGSPIPEGTRALELWSEPLLVAVPDGHRLAERDRIETRDLWDETLIAPARPQSGDDVPWGDWYEAIDAELPERCRIAALVTSVDETIELVAAGMGLNILGASAISLYARPGVSFVPLETEARVRSMLLVRDESMSGVLSRFVALARKSVEGLETEA